MSSCVSPAASRWRASRRWWAVRLGGLPKRTPLAFARVYTTKPSFRAPSGYATATLTPSKGRLMRCTVDGLTPSRSAMTRMPGRPGVARASRIRFSSAGAIGGRPRRFPSLLARASPARTRSWIMARSNSANLWPQLLRSLSRRLRASIPGSREWRRCACQGQDRTTSSDASSPARW